MESPHLHIVCLDVPYPVDYGGVFDLFYKIKTLSEAGVQIHLHCFEYGRGRAPVLETMCREVHYYERVPAVKCLFTGLPYIVASRANPLLLKNLRKDNHPVLLEGMHCTAFVHSGDIPPERSFIRLHNVETRYYRQLSETTRSLFRKFYFSHESRLLSRYEASMAGKGTYFTVSDTDLRFFRDELGYQKITQLPLFLPPFQQEWNGEKGHFCLYHGNLSVPENDYAATWLLEEIFSKTDIPFVVAGKNPSKQLEKLAHAADHTCLVANPDEREMQELIRKAQVNILPSFNNTGIKLKLVNALRFGRHCLVNEAGVAGSGLESLCEVANTTAQMIQQIEKLFYQPFHEYLFQERQQKLQDLFDNRNNARKLLQFIFPGYRPDDQDKNASGAMMDARRN